MEIDEQSDGDIQQLHVTEELRFAEWMQGFNSLEFKEQAVIDQDVEPQWFIEDKTLIFDPNRLLCGRWNRAQIKFAQHTSLVDRFYQPLSHVPMDFNSRPNYVVANSICLLIQGVHEKEF